MLISATLKNIYSFEGLTTFSLVAGKTKHFPKRAKNIVSSKLNVLSFSAVYGPNASGKTNLLKALYKMGEIVLGGAPTFIEDCSFHGCDDPVSYFEIEFEQDNQLFDYGLEFNFAKNEFVSEWLHEYVGEEEKIIFERDLVHKSILFEPSVAKKDVSKVNAYKDEAKIDLSTSFISIFIDKVVRAKVLEKRGLEAIVLTGQFITDCFEPVFPDDRIDPFQYFVSDSSLQELSAYLAHYDTGIKRLQKSLMSEDDVRRTLPSKYIKQFESTASKGEERSAFLRSKKDMILIDVPQKGTPLYYRITFIHDIHGKEVPMNLDEESDGTIRIMDLAWVILNKKKNVVFFVDELDRCLHPLLTVRFIKEFLKKCEEEDNHNQLIVTTHESLLMDLELLRRDEIWFVEKKDGHSDLYSLEDFQERFDKKVDKSYMNGRYGAIPRFQDALGDIADDED